MLVLHLVVLKSKTYIYGNGRLESIRYDVEDICRNEVSSNVRLTQVWIGLLVLLSY